MEYPHRAWQNYTLPLNPHDLRLILVIVHDHVRPWSLSSTSGVQLSDSPQLTRNALQQSRTCATVLMMGNGCLYQAATRVLARQVCSMLCSCREMDSVHSIQLPCFTRTDLSHLDELPTLKSGTIWISRYRNIVDYLRKYSAGEWDLESGLSKQQRADSIA